MMYYARCDTHFLLFVYDTMRNDLVERSDPSDPQNNLIEVTLQRSKETSLDRYNSYTADHETGEGTRGWANALMKYATRLDGPQFAVYRALHKWRDDLARKEDEGPIYIMPQQTLVEISKLLPVDPKALHSLLGSRCASIVQRSLTELFEVISNAKKEGATGPSSVEFLRGTFVDNSVGAVAERELHQDKRPKPELPPVEQLRAQKSQLFGDMAVSSLWETSKTTNKNPEKLISLPWTTYVQDAMISSAQQEAAAKAKEQDMILLESTPKVSVPSTKPSELDNAEFTLRQGRKRKQREVSADGDEGGGAALNSGDMISLDVVSGDDDENDPAARKKAERAERKRRKKAKREANNNTAKQPRTSKAKRMPADNDGDREEGEDEEEEETPFDYSTAQSVLHAQRTMAIGGGGGGKDGAGSRGGRAGQTKKPFDPYAARINAEGPKPDRRMHGQKPGMMQTFKK